MIAQARIKYLGVSAQKTRLVVDQLRGKNVGEAIAILRYSPKLVARDLSKVVHSAVANAHGFSYELDCYQFLPATHLDHALADRFWLPIEFVRHPAFKFC